VQHCVAVCEVLRSWHTSSGLPDPSLPPLQPNNSISSSSSNAAAAAAGVHDDTQPAAGDSDTSSGDWCGLGVSPAIVREWYVSYIELLRRCVTNHTRTHALLHFQSKRTDVYNVRLCNC
jgi:hypothetical protein